MKLFLIKKISCLLLFKNSERENKNYINVKDFKKYG